MFKHINEKEGEVDTSFTCLYFNKTGRLKFIEYIFFQGYSKEIENALLKDKQKERLLDVSTDNLKADNPKITVYPISISADRITKEFIGTDCKKEFENFIMPILSYSLNRERIDSGWKSLRPNLIRARVDQASWQIEKIKGLLEEKKYRNQNSKPTHNWNTLPIHQNKSYYQNIHPKN